MVFGTISSNGDVMLQCIFSPLHRLKTDALIKCLEEEMLHRIERVFGERPYVGKDNTVPCHTRRSTQCWRSGKFCDHIHPNICPLTLYIAISLIIICAAHLSKRSTKLNAIRKINWSMITAAFAYINKVIVRKVSEVVWRPRLKS